MTHERANGRGLNFKRDETKMTFSLSSKGRMIAQLPPPGFEASDRTGSDDMTAPR